MAVYQQYGTGTKTETKKKKSDDDSVDVGTKNTNTNSNTNSNTNRSGSVVALMSTLVTVVSVVIVMYVQASASFSSTALEEANLLRTGTGTNTVIIDDSAAAGVVVAPPLPPKIGALLASFILSYDSYYYTVRCDSCVDRLTHKDVPWKNACKCLVDICPNEVYRCKQDDSGRNCQIAADRFSSCDDEEYDKSDFETCLNSFPYNQPESATELVECVLKYYRTCFSLHPPSPSRT